LSEGAVYRKAAIAPLKGERKTDLATSLGGYLAGFVVLLHNWPIQMTTNRQ
jgi:hypothetical protein